MTWWAISGSGSRIVISRTIQTRPKMDRRRLMPWISVGMWCAGGPGTLPLDTSTPRIAIGSRPTRGITRLASELGGRSYLLKHPPTPRTAAWPTASTSPRRRSGARRRGRGRHRAGTSVTPGCDTDLRSSRYVMGSNATRHMMYNPEAVPAHIPAAERMCRYRKSKQTPGCADLRARVSGIGFAVETRGRGGAEWRGGCSMFAQSKLY
jgi:hypothetical protein